jgi:hypothetical protein
MQGMNWQRNLIRCCLRWVGPLLGVCSLLVGSTDKVCPTTPDWGLKVYDGCLDSHETATEATQIGPFTTLAILYVNGYGYFGTHRTYQRLLYKGRILASEVSDVQPWNGLSSPVLFADWYVGDDLGSLHLIYERGRQPIVERIVRSGSGWRADQQFPYGYPLQSGTRYFPRTFGGFDAGFLLDVLPTRLTKLPLGPEGVSVPSVQSLAGIAPDGTAYAYADSETNPSAVVVVNADGTLRDPIPIPFTTLALGFGPNINLFDPLWRWFGLTFKWEKDTRGRWDIRPTWADAAASASNPVEEPFIDGVSGYHSCFVSANRACLQGWRPVHDGASRFGDCCLSRYVYEPAEQTQAFGADVQAVVYSKSAASNSGYRLLLNSPADRVIATLTTRLQGRKVQFVRTDQCKNFAPDYDECIARLNQTFHPNGQLSQELLSAIFRATDNTAIFVTPTVAFAVYAAPKGRTWVDTLARYALPMSKAPDTKQSLAMSDGTNQY